MAYINLLPWRLRLAQARQKRRQRRWIALATLMVALGGVYYLQVSQRLAQQTQVLKHQHQQLTSAIEAASNTLQERQHLAQQLTAVKQPLLEAILQHLPEGVALLSLAQQDQQIHLKARAPSQQLAAPMLQSLQGLAGLTEVRLQQLFGHTDNAQAEFELSAAALNDHKVGAYD